MRVVVTGGAGFIGASVCNALAEDAGIDRVIAFDDLSTGSAENVASPGIDLVEGSILDGDLVRDIVRGADAVVHLAARPSIPRSLADPMATYDVNVMGTVQVLEAVRNAGGPHLVIASSSSVYGANPTVPKDEDLVPRPVSPYAASKLGAEVATLAHASSFGIDALAFRFFNVFGPLQRADHAYAAVVPAFLAAAIAGKPLVVHGDGTQTRDFTFVDSVVAVLVDAIRRRVTSEGPVNLAFGTRTSLLEVVAALEDVFGHPLEVEHVEPRPGDVRHSQAATERLGALFPDVEPVSLEDGLARTAEWFRSLEPS